MSERAGACGGGGGSGVYCATKTLETLRKHWLTSSPSLPPREHSQARLQSASHLSTSPNLNLTVTFPCRNKSSRETKFHPERELAHGTILSRPSGGWLGRKGSFLAGVTRD